MYWASQNGHHDIVLALLGEHAEVNKARSDVSGAILTVHFINVHSPKNIIVVPMTVLCAHDTWFGMRMIPFFPNINMIHVHVFVIANVFLREKFIVVAVKECRVINTSMQAISNYMYSVLYVMIM